MARWPHGLPDSPTSALVAPLFTAFVADEPLMTKVFKSRGAPKAPEQILTEDKLYMADEADDARVREYYDARDALLQARYELPGKDYCPAAMAKCARSAAETALQYRADGAEARGHDAGHGRGRRPSSLSRASAAVPKGSFGAPFRADRSSSW